MKKKLGILVVIVLFIRLLMSFADINQVTPEEARQALSAHLLKKYGEEFEIRYLGRRAHPRGSGEFYQADIIPSRYVDTGKYRDEYYWRLGNVNLGIGILGEKIKYTGDTYNIVRANESANEYFMPKLEELFGKQVLPIFQIRSSIVSRRGDFIETLNLNKNATIGGGVYIFGRIDDLAEKEVYREKIFEFIQYMREQELFDEKRVDLAFYILDERCLTERFDTEVGYQLVEARKNLKTADEFISYRMELMSTLEEEFENMTDEERLERIDRYDRMNLRDIWGDDDMRNKLNKYSFIYHKGIYSRKFLEVELRLRHIKKLDYDELEDLKLLNTMKIDYNEYVRENLHNNEWDGE